MVGELSCHYSCFQLSLFNSDVIFHKPFLTSFIKELMTNTLSPFEDFLQKLNELEVLLGCCPLKPALCSSKCVVRWL